MSDGFSALRAVPTIGTRYHELEEMGGTTALGVLAIKNNLECFLHLLSMHEGSEDALNQQDIYGNTPLHYWALRGFQACGVVGYLQEMGGDFGACNFAGESVSKVMETRSVTCKEPGVPIGARYSAERMDIAVVCV